MLKLLHPPDSLRSGCDIFSTGTAREVTKAGVACQAIELWPQKWAQLLGDPRLSRLRGRGFAYKYGPALCSAWRVTSKITTADVVWVLGVAWPMDRSCFFEKRIRRKSGSYVFYLMDDWFSVPAMAPLAHARVNIADLVVVVTKTLRERVLEFYPHANVEVVEEPVDVDRLRSGKPIIGSDLPLVVWTGSPSSLIDFIGLIPTLSKVYQEVPYRLRVVCGNTRPLIDLPFVWEWLPFDLKSEADHLAGATAGLAPLADSLYARCKNQCKVRIYAGAGVPVLASNFESNATVVRNGETGFLLDSIEEWQEALLRLLKNPAFAKQMGEAARMHAVERFSQQAVAPQWAAIVRRHFGQKAT